MTIQTNAPFQVSDDLQNLVNEKVNFLEMRIIARTLRQLLIPQKSGLSYPDTPCMPKKPPSLLKNHW